MSAISNPLYLDNAATTPVAPEVRAALEPWLGEEYGNPSSRHPPGLRAADAVDRSRRSLARILGARAEDIVFTSGGTEANNLAVLGLARAARRRGAHVVFGPTEHPSVRMSAEALREEGFEVECARLAPGGGLDLEHFAGLLRPDTVLVAQMLVNNEFGTIYPVRRLSRLVRGASSAARLHVDAVQALGKLPLSLGELGADSLSISAHKVHGLKGTGALALGRELSLRPLVFGGGQEGGRRGGTENVVGIVALGRAAELAEERRDANTAAMAAAREALIAGLAEVRGARLVEAGGERAPNIVAVELEGPPAEVYMHHLEARGVFVSAGSACGTKSKEISPALQALDFDDHRARRVLRFSFSGQSLPEEASRAAAILAELAHELEAVGG